MIKKNDNWEYDKTRHEYIATNKYVINNLPYQESEVSERIENFEKWLKRYSRRIYQYIYNANLNSSRQFIHYKIALNLNGEREAILDSIVEYVMGAMEGELDLNPYHNDKTDIPFTIEPILRNAGLLRVGSFYGVLPDYGDY